MASIRKLTKPNRKGKFPWVVEYTDADGKRCRRTPKSGLMKDAEALKRDIERQLDDGTHTARSRTATFGQATEVYLESCRLRHRNKQRMTGATLEKIERQCRNDIPEWLARKKLTDLEVDDFQKVVNALSERLSAGGVRTIAPMYGQILKAAMRKKWIKVNVLRELPLSLPLVTRKRDVPSKTDLKKLLAALSERRFQEHGHTYMMRVTTITLALFAGLRRGEIAGLQWENVDFVKGRICVRHSLSRYDGLKGPKSVAGNRDIDMAPPVRQLLTKLARIAGENRTGYVLTARADRTSPIRVGVVAGVYLLPVMKSAGLVDENGKLKFNLHQLRHAAISLLIEQGLDPLQIKRIAGHATIKMTMDVYGHLFPEDERAKEAIDTASAQFNLSVDRRPSYDDRKRLGDALQDDDATKTRHLALTD